MSLGENLQYVRKRDDITQEQLAEKLNVSRQSVSKWESDTSYPEMDKLLQLCQIFHCSMDDFVQGNIEDIHVEDKDEYDTHMNHFSKFISIGIALILMGVVSMFLLYGINFFFDSDVEIIKEDFTSVFFFIFLIIAVAILIINGIQHSDFINRHPVIDQFYTQKEIDSFNKKFSIMIATGVSIILIGNMILIATTSIYPEFDTNEYLESLLMSFFMIFITFGTTIIVYAALQKDKYNIDKYNEANNKEGTAYKKGKLTGTVNACIMLVCTIIYLILAFKFNSFGMPYVLVYAVGGVCCAISTIIIDYKEK